MPKLRAKQLMFLKATIHCLNLGFFAYLIMQIFMEGFGVDPVEAITHFTGIAALNLLFITLLVTPFAQWVKQSQLFRCRRILGLYCFFWACLHMMTYFWLNLGLNFSLMATEIVKRPYLTLGAICWLILFALAITSTNKIQRKMGRQWQKLHNWVYLVLLLAPIHFYWSVKSEIIEPSIYLFFALFLLLTRRKKLLGFIKK